MIAKEDLVEGRTYELAEHVEHNDVGTPVIFKWWTKDGKWAICNPVGEPDMQSSMCLGLNELRKCSDDR